MAFIITALSNCKSSCIHQWYMCSSFRLFSTKQCFVSLLFECKIKHNFNLNWDKHDCTKKKNFFFDSKLFFFLLKIHELTYTQLSAKILVQFTQSHSMWSTTWSTKKTSTSDSKQTRTMSVALVSVRSANCIFGCYWQEKGSRSVYENSDKSRTIQLDREDGRLLSL